MKLACTIIASLLMLSSLGQIAPDTYYIQFTDKNNTPYSLDNPAAFLTERSIQRRVNQGIALTEDDLPINPAYLQGVAATGASLLFPTKWLNGVTIVTTSQSVLNAIQALPYVLSLRQLTAQPSKQAIKEKIFFSGEEVGSHLKPSQVYIPKSSNSFDYGSGFTQINQINGIGLHEQGFRGQGMVIALLDGGYLDVETHMAFDSLWTNNQILGTKDFVHPGGNVFTESSHGTSVLSTIASNAPGQLIGTAPKASFWLLRPEYVFSEHLVEEYNWVSAAEFADSVGVDIINSSLGYIDFDFPQWNHSYEHMDGNTSVVTIGADLAASKGILVVNSAGNSGGNSSFPYIGAPADGNDVFSIGAVNGAGVRAGFSSIGPTFDGRIKPDVMAMGQGTALANGNNVFTFGNGTSFSSPVIAGMSACLWQAHPTLSNLDVKQSIMMSGSLSGEPNSTNGFGIPDYLMANAILTSIDSGEQKDNQLISIHPNPFGTILNIRFLTQEDMTITINDLRGMVVRQFVSGYGQAGELRQTLNQLPAGCYFVTAMNGNKKQSLKLVKVN